MKVQLSAAHPDHNYWAKCPYWTIDECAALLLDLDPHGQNVDANGELASHRVLIERAQKCEQLRKEPAPGEVLGWARSIKIVCPEALEKAVAETGQPIVGLVKEAEAAKQTTALWKGQFEQKEKDHETCRQQLVAAQEEIAQLNAERWTGFNTDDPTYPAELDIALQAHRYASLKEPETTHPKKLLKEWLKGSGNKLSLDAIERIATVCNWKPGGGH